MARIAGKARRWQAVRHTKPRLMAGREPFSLGRDAFCSKKQAVPTGRQRFPTGRDRFCPGKDCVRLGENCSRPGKDWFLTRENCILTRENWFLTGRESFPAKEKWAPTEKSRGLERKLLYKRLLESNKSSLWQRHTIQSKMMIALTGGRILSPTVSRS